MAERTVGLPLERFLQGKVKLDGRRRTAVRLASPYPHANQTQLYAHMGLIDGLLAPPGGFKTFLRRQVLPPSEVLREHARKDRRRRANSSLGHCVRMLSRFGLAMTRLLRAPESI